MKYPIKKEFGIFAKFKLPVNGFTLRMAKIILSVVPKGMRYSKNLSIQTLKIPCRDSKKIKLYLIRPKNCDGKLPVIFNIHGGGFVFKGAPYHYKLAKEYALRTNSAVIFPDYRLAFDTPFGTTLFDCLDAYRYMLNKADELRINTHEITIVGDSAGGYLAVTLAKQIAEAELAAPKKELLIYLVADPDMTTSSMQKFPDTPMWNSKCNKKMWQYYSKGKKVYSPLTDDLSFMPETFIETAEFDCLHDDGTALYEHLKICGINCEINETLGTMHGYDIRINSPTAREAIEKRINFICKN